MRLMIALALVFVATTQMSAQSMKDIIKSIPDSITPLLSKNTRLDFIDYLEAGQKAEEKNLLAGDSEMVSLTDTRSVIRMTGASTMDIKVFKSAESFGHANNLESIKTEYGLNASDVIAGIEGQFIGVISTFKSNDVYSSFIRFYSTDWKLLGTIIPTEFLQLEWNDDSEEMKATRYNPLELKFE